METAHVQGKSFQVEVHWRDGGLSEEVIYEESEDGWAQLLGYLLADRYPDDTGEWLHLEWLGGDARRVETATLFARFPARIRNRPNDLD
jgi:hypothetical protein